MNAYLFSLNKDASVADQWDFGFLQEFLIKNDFEIKSVSKLPKTERAIVVIPARHHAGKEIDVLIQLNKIDHVVLFLMGDEEADFDVETIIHDSIHIWVQNPHIGKHDAYNKIGTGFPPHFKQLLSEIDQPFNKPLDLFYAGQMTHDRRIELNDVLTGMSLGNKHIEFLSTSGFTQGMEHLEYAKKIASAKIAPAPSGAVIPDSFRLFEALEAMAIPVADQKTPSGEIMEYWDWLFGEITPFPRVTNWGALPGIYEEIMQDWPHNMHKITAWYLMFKRNFKNKVMEQYNG